MNTKDLTIIKSHFGNPRPFRVATAEDGVFPPSQLGDDEVTEIPVSILEGTVVEGHVTGRGGWTGEVSTDTDYIAYVPNHALGKPCACINCQ
jgi:hypothetical protein